MSEATQITQETLLQLSRNDAQFEDRLRAFLDQVRAVTDLIWAGSQNEQLIDIPPVPELRVTGTINWTLNNHSAMIRARWIDDFQLCFNSAALFCGQLFFNNTDMADDILYTDIKYSYTFPDLLGSDR